MATFNSFFVFGPSQTFIAVLPGLRAQGGNFSTDLGNVIDNENSKSLSFVVFVGGQANHDDSTNGTASQAYVGYHKKHGLMGAGRLYCPPEKALTLPNLEEWIKKQDDKTEGMQVVCNGIGGYWARSSKGIRRQEHLSSETWQWMKEGNPHGNEIVVALGINDSYIIGYENGHTVWDLKGAYDTLDAKLSQILGQGQSTGLMYASLNPYHEDEYFCTFKDSSCIYKFPDSNTFRDVEQKLLFDCSLRVVIDSPTLRSSKDMVKISKAKGNNNKKSLSEEIAIDACKTVLKSAERESVQQGFAAIGGIIASSM